ncbi:MAG: hypothetical protein JRF63_06465, partial [Deltaproteobacteria bacterium]|nr:hypothetical protein [Deltaproteobacteria bacterium]
CSLSTTIGRLRSEFSSLRNELSDTKRENNALRSELDLWRSKYQALRGSDMASLRRNVSFYCHPDRGGNTELMSRLNALFDFLAGGAASTRVVEECRKGRAA